MPSDLQSKLEAVCDEETFIAFVTALAADREEEVAKEKETPSSPYGPGANGWENGSIEAFLDAAAAWATASKNDWSFTGSLIILGRDARTSSTWARFTSRIAEPAGCTERRDRVSVGNRTSLARRR